MEEADGEGKGESERHRELKDMALAWARSERFSVAAREVRLPLSHFRADVAAYRPQSRMAEEPGDTLLIECKQSRADFLKDAGCEKSARSLENRLVERVGRLRALLAIHLPHCRRGLSLFREYDEYDFSSQRHEGWQRAQARLQMLERRLQGGVKFSRIARYGCGNYCYLATGEDVVQSESELPLGWGWLLWNGEAFERRRSALRLRSDAAARLKLLERIAARLGR